ncbi:conjugal transfer protein, partial [Salmonella enterica subsp. enterica serovar Typhimurium]|nr:conjugal transfer protein [Salmonella enterica subsp. enterica serovar Typhimurium]
MNADSVQAVIDHTQAIRAQSNNSDAVNDIIRRRDEIQENASLNEAALKAVEN